MKIINLAYARFLHPTEPPVCFLSSAPLLPLPGLHSQHATMQLRPKMNQICCCGTWIIFVSRLPGLQTAVQIHFICGPWLCQQQTQSGGWIHPQPAAQLLAPAAPVCMLTNIKMCWIISVGVVQLPATTFINIYNFFPTHPNIVLVVAGGKSC